jgi:hypothetical protein
MKNRVRRRWAKRLPRKRVLRETINAQLQNSSHIEHLRHRCVTGFMVQVGAGLIASSQRPKKPALGLRREPLLPMLVIECTRTHVNN